MDSTSSSSPSSSDEGGNDQESVQKSPPPTATVAEESTSRSPSGRRMQKPPRKKKRITTRLRMSDPAILHQMSDSLEHVIIVGMKTRRDMWRRNQYLTYTHASSDDANDGPATAAKIATEPPPSIINDNNSTSIVHAEDLHLYKTFKQSMLTGKRGVSGAIPPKDKMDVEWQAEHGDGVDYDSFYKTRLSQRPPPSCILPGQSYLQQSHHSSKHSNYLLGFSGIPTRTQVEDIPRDLLLKCWQRAVHVASNAIHAPVTKACTAATEMTIAMTDNTTSLNMNTSLSREDIVQRCKTLGIDLWSQVESNQNETDKRTIGDTYATATTTTMSTAVRTTVGTTACCPRCSRTFSTFLSCEDHYYGNEDQIGCCRPILREKQLDLINDILLQQIQMHTEELWRVLSSQFEANDDKQDTHPQKLKAKTKNIATQAASRSNKPNDRVVDWIQVQNLLQQAVAASAVQKGFESQTGHTVNNPCESDGNEVRDNRESRTPRPPTRTHEVLKRLKSTEDLSDDDTGKESSLILNPMVLAAVNRRLIDRYAEIPP